MGGKVAMATVVVRMEESMAARRVAEGRVTVVGAEEAKGAVVAMEAAAAVETTVAGAAKAALMATATRNGCTQPTIAATRPQSRNVHPCNLRHMNRGSPGPWNRSKAVPRTGRPRLQPAAPADTLAARLPRT